MADLTNHPTLKADNVALPLCYCARCKLKTAHWYDRVFYAFFCTLCDERAARIIRGTGTASVQKSLVEGQG